MSATVQIVDGVGGSVLADLNSSVGAPGVALTNRSSINLAETALAQVQDRPVVWTPGSPEEIVHRQITVPMAVIGSSADDKAARIATIMQYTRSPFWLKIQRHGASSPVYLQCWPCLPQFTSSITAADRAVVGLGTLIADTVPYGLGARVDVSSVSVTQDPAGSNAFALDVTGVGGDSLTPVVIRSTDSQVARLEDSIMFSVRRRGSSPTSFAVPFSQAEANGAGLAIGGSDAPTTSVYSAAASEGYSGNSAARATFPASTPSSSNPPGMYLNFTAGMASGSAAPGVYRLLVRLVRSGDNPEFDLSASIGGQSAVVTGGSIYSTGGVTASGVFGTGGNNTRIIDCGLVQVPVGHPQTLSSPQSPASATWPSWTLAVYKTTASSSSCTLDVDWAALVPSDEDCGKLTVAAPLPASSQCLVLDGFDHTPRVYSVDPYGGSGSSAVAMGTTTINYIGGVPRLKPGANRLFLVAGLGAAASNARDKTSTLTVSASYWPRYAWLA